MEQNWSGQLTISHGGWWRWRSHERKTPYCDNAELLNDSSGRGHQSCQGLNGRGLWAALPQCGPEQGSATVDVAESTHREGGVGGDGCEAGGVWARSGAGESWHR